MVTRLFTYKQKIKHDLFAERIYVLSCKWFKWINKYRVFLWNKKLEQSLNILQDFIFFPIRTFLYIMVFLESFRNAHQSLAESIRWGSNFAQCLYSWGMISWKIVCVLTKFWDSFAGKFDLFLEIFSSWKIVCVFHNFEKKLEHLEN